MLSKINRLKAVSDFKLIFYGGKNSENQFIKIRFIKNKKDYSRIGFIVSSKFTKKSVDRNIIKRRLRAAVRFLLKNIKPGFDIVIWPKKMLKNSDLQVIINNVKIILNKNDLLFI